MSVKSLIPNIWSRETGDSDPFRTLQKEIDRVFNRFQTNDFMNPSFSSWQDGTSASMLPAIDISETETQIKIEAELPGIDKDDVDITVVDQHLTIRGNTNAEQETKEKNYHLIERSKGSFKRVIPLGFKVDSEQVDASFKNGVLTLTVTKPPEFTQNVKKIKVNSAETA